MSLGHAGLTHVACYAGRAIVLQFLDAATDNMGTHAGNLVAAARAVTRAARECASDRDCEHAQLLSLLMAAEFLGSLSVACSEEADHVANRAQGGGS